MRGTATDRVLRIFDAIRSYGPPRVALERAIYFPGALDASCIDGIGGFATCIDSLAAVKHLIYDTPAQQEELIARTEEQMG